MCLGRPFQGFGSIVEDRSSKGPSLPREKGKEGGEKGTVLGDYVGKILSFSILPLVIACVRVHARVCEERERETKDGHGGWRVPFPLVSPDQW